MKTFLLALMCLVAVATSLGTWRAQALREPRVVPAAASPAPWTEREDDDDDEEDEEDYRAPALALLALADPAGFERAARLQAPRRTP